MTLRHRVRDALLKVGLDDYVETYQRRRLPAMTVRDQRDMENLSLLMRFWLRPDSNCVDIGANRGDVLREMFTVSPHGQHLAFEPLPDHAEALRAEFPAATVQAVALSNATGEAEFTRITDEGMSGYSGFRKQWYPTELHTETIKVTVARLDDSLPPGYVPMLVKIDVEGAERDVIDGGMETLRKHQPIVVFEHFEGGAGSYGSTPEDLHRMLVDDAGYDILDIDGVGPYSAGQMREVFDSRRLWTWVARPR